MLPLETSNTRPCEVPVSLLTQNSIMAPNSIPAAAMQQEHLCRNSQFPEMQNAEILDPTEAPTQDNEDDDSDELEPETITEWIALFLATLKSKSAQTYSTVSFVVQQTSSLISDIVASLQRKAFPLFGKLGHMDEPWFQELDCPWFWRSTMPIHIFTWQKRENVVLLDFYDGEHCKQHPLFSSKVSVPLLLHNDDCETVNRRGSKVVVHKLGFLYFTIKSPPSEFLSLVALSVCSLQIGWSQNIWNW